MKDSLENKEGKLENIGGECRLIYEEGKAKEIELTETVSYFKRPSFYMYFCAYFTWEYLHAVYDV